MTREEYKKLLLGRVYEVFYKEKQPYGPVNIWAFSKALNVDPQLGFQVIDELRETDYIATELAGGTYEFGPAALLLCEKHGLADSALIDYQRNIRLKLLVTLAEKQELAGLGDGIPWQDWIRAAAVDEEDFNRNLGIMIYQNLVINDAGSPYDYVITTTGRDIYADYRKRVRRAEDFERLEKLEGVTEQQRGHKLEDLLADSAEWEGWEVTRRVRAQGQENDIIMHVGLNYFLNSCKWESDPIQSVEVDILFSRVHSRAQTNGGIIFSMSGFTDNCIEEIRLKIGTARIIAFGCADIKLIMCNETTMTSLLDEKIDQLMNHRTVLIDGINHN